MLERYIEVLGERIKGFNSSKMYHPIQRQIDPSSSSQIVNSVVKILRSGRFSGLM